MRRAAASSATRRPCAAGRALRSRGAAQGYTLGAAQLGFAVTAQLGGGQALALSPAAPFAASADGTVAAQLLGDLAGYAAMPDFGAFLLMVPQEGNQLAGMRPGWEPARRPSALTRGRPLSLLACGAGAAAAAAAAAPAGAPLALTANMSDWLLVGQSQVTLDGSACNAAGVGYMAFRSQPARRRALVYPPRAPAAARKRGRMRRPPGLPGRRASATAARRRPAVRQLQPPRGGLASRLVPAAATCNAVARSAFLPGPAMVDHLAGAHRVYPTRPYARPTAPSAGEAERAGAWQRMGRSPRRVCTRCGARRTRATCPRAAAWAGSWAPCARPTPRASRRAPRRCTGSPAGPAASPARCRRALGRPRPGPAPGAAGAELP